MLKSSDYNHKLYEIAKEGKFGGRFEIKKKEDSKGEILQGYSSLEGRVWSEELLDSYSGVELHVDGDLTMSDSPLEQEAYQPAVDLAKGKVLMCGLGIGLFPAMIGDRLKSGEITQLDIVELERPLIDWVGEYLNPHYPGINIIEGDAWDYPKTTHEKYNLVLIDIWQGIVCALAEGPKISKLYMDLLVEDGRVLYWMEEIRAKMRDERGAPNPSSTECPVCDRSPNTFTSMLYGCLCKECADEYESFLYGDKETHANAELTRTLQSLGYKTLKPKVSDMDIADLVIEGGGKRYLIECKKSLVDSNMFKNLREKVISYSELRDQYDGLKIVMHGKVNPGLVLKLGKFIETMNLGDWVEVLFKGELEA